MKLTIQHINASNDQEIQRIIEQVGTEFGTIGEGFGPSDPEVMQLSEHYGHQPNSQYLIAWLDGEMVGGGGLAPLANSTKVCELKKLFLLPKARGLGIGKALAQQNLAFAQQMGFKQCYLDTFHSMTNAIALYRKLGFRPLTAPHPLSEHSACTVWMIKELTPLNSDLSSNQRMRQTT